MKNLCSCTVRIKQLWVSSVSNWVQRPSWHTIGHLNVLYIQLISIVCSSRGFLLSLPRGRLLTLQLKFGTTYPLTSNFPIPSPPLNTVLKCTYLNSFRTSLPPSSPPSDWLTAPQIQPCTDLVHSINFRIITIIIVFAANHVTGAKVPVFPVNQLSCTTLCFKKFEFLISQGSVATCLRWGG